MSESDYTVSMRINDLGMRLMGSEVGEEVAFAVTHNPGMELAEIILTFPEEATNPSMFATIAFAGTFGDVGVTSLGVSHTDALAPILASAFTGMGIFGRWIGLGATVTSQHTDASAIPTDWTLTIFKNGVAFGEVPILFATPTGTDLKTSSRWLIPGTTTPVDLFYNHEDTIEYLASGSAIDDPRFMVVFLWRLT